jgi:hypothetical protein
MFLDYRLHSSLLSSHAMLTRTELLMFVDPSPAAIVGARKAEAVDVRPHVRHDRVG